MMNKDDALALLKAANVFFDEEDIPQKHVINMNDVWGWACADCEEVPDEKLLEVGELFRQYGWAGILYWCSEQRGGCRSEFHDNNRFIDFVRHEERLRKDVPDGNKRAYTKVTYTLSDT